MRFHPTSRSTRIIAAMLGIFLLTDVLHPTIAWALTSGPAQPEFTSFEPVVTTTMVNEFSGDLTYNLPVLSIPGPDGSGYAMSLSYHSGASPEEEASWVGSGWTLNPGSITRQMNGIPDDWNGETVKHFNKAPASRTVSISGNVINPEILSVEVPFSLSGSIRYNNYTGFGYSTGIGFKFAQGVVSLGYQVNNGEGSFSLTVNPGAILTKKMKALQKDIQDLKIKAEAIKKSNLTDAQKKEAIAAVNKEKDAKSRELSKKQTLSPIKAASIASNYGIRSLSPPSFQQSTNEMTGESYQLSIGMNISVLPPQGGLQGSLAGRYAIQENQEEVPRGSYGYLHSEEATDPRSSMDYHADHATLYDKRDKFLPLPVADADNFMATGEGVMGNMRFFSSRPAVFNPAAGKSHTTITQIGFEVNILLNNGGSVDAGIGTQTVESGPWGDERTPVPQPLDEPFTLRMTNDPGGWFMHNGSDAPQNASISTSGFTGYRTGTYENQLPEYAQANNGVRSGRSSHVGYSTNGEMLSNPWLSYERAPLNNDGDDEGVVANGPARGDLEAGQLGEISVLNEGGTRYNYALPVYTRNEKALSYHYNAPDHKAHWTQGPGDDPELSPVKSGTTSESRYATSFLLTSITTPDFLDRTYNGPTPDDHGGYTRFFYAKHSHAGGGYFDWRMPYEGFSYSDSELSECTDNRISFSSGQKEIYYLDRIATKTHEARFIRSTRTDALGGAGQTTERLDRIELYATGGTSEELIRTVRFEYADESGSVWPGTPNTVSGNGGKLTLKKVWFEHNGIVPAKISPYVFEYEYPSEPYPEPYAALSAPDLNEDPDFTYFSTDPWGNYRSDGSRYDVHRPWLDQKINESGHDPGFDPAAHQLKRIVLPSGGEIHIQYEQDDYAHVQNEPAHAMAPITSSPLPNVFIVRVSDILPEEDLVNGHSSATIAQKVRDFYQTAGRKIFFKTLYALSGGASSAMELTDRRWEYITGYASVLSASPHDEDHIAIALDPTGSHSLPIQVCNSLYNAEKRGKDLGQSCESGMFTDGAVSNSGGDAEQIITDFLSFASSPFASPCQSLAMEYSYFRIPIGGRKLGGGLRVKRLLMFDQQGADEGYPSLYGSEYIYRTLDANDRIISSGVATYEPGSIREENVLVRPLDRLHQSWLNRAIAGRDLEQSEGPVAESLYPGASVGYSQVIVRDIHQGATAPAFSVKQFHTAKDHPIHVETTAIDAPVQDHLPITTGIVDIIRTNAWGSQGYAVHLNDMHGKPSGESSYHGNVAQFLRGEPCILLASHYTDYFAPGESIPIMTDALGNVAAALPLGKERDVTIETRSTRDDLYDGTVEVDLGAGVYGFIVLPSFSMMATVSHVHTQMSSHSITKVISSPGIVKRTRTFKDGIHHISENVAFDRNTGKPLIVRTHDGFYAQNPSIVQDLAEAEGTYTSVTVPAAMAYGNMGQVALGEHRRTKLVNSSSSEAAPCIRVRSTANSGGSAVIEIGLSAGALAEDPPLSLCELLGSMCEGDLFEIKDGSNSNIYRYHLSRMDGTELHLIKASSSPHSLTAPAQNFSMLTTLRSGCENKLSSVAGTFTYYGPSQLQSADPLFPERQVLMDLLNDKVAALFANPSSLQSIPAADFSELQLADNSGACIVGNTQPITLAMVGDAVQIEFTAACSKYLLGIPNSDAPFSLDPENGMLLFHTIGSDCFGRSVPCPRFCAPQYPVHIREQVVQSRATEFSDSWDYVLAEYDEWVEQTTANVFESGIKGQWRPRSNFSYLTALEDGTRNDDQGMYKLRHFNWNAADENLENFWVMTDRTTAYSPDGHALEEIDALGRPGCAKYGYDRTLPYLIAQNSWSGSSVFESFERQYPTSPATFEDHLQFSGTWASTGQHVGDMAHSGRSSYRSSASSALLFKGKTLDTRWPETGPAVQRASAFSIKAWIRSTSSDGKARNASDVLLVSASSGTVPMDIVARSGEWVLYSADIPVSELIDTETFDITCTNVSGSTTWIDDVRIQPQDAQMSTYVYDPATFRVSATFDDQHFGLFYQYNAEGRLVRKMIETERGMRTVQETHYNSPGQPNLP